MAPDQQNPQLIYARPLAEARRPRQEVLLLPDGYRTSVYVHSPPVETNRMPIVYLHGIQSHPGWFVPSAAYLAEMGYPVFQITRRGSGLNGLDRGGGQSAEQLLADVGVVCRFAADESQTNCVHLIGVSWGGKLAACYGADPARSVPLASLTLVAPGIVPKVDVSTKMKLAIAFSLLTRSEKMFDIPLSDPSLFTENQVMQHYITKDPSRLQHATARFLYASRSLDRMLRRAGPGRLGMPTTLILASRDRIINNAATEKLVAHLAGDKLEVKRLLGAHTLEFEADPQLLLDALVQAVQRGE